MRPTIYPTTFYLRDCFLCCNAIFQVSLKENRNSQEITGVGTVSLLTSSVADDPRLVRVHTLGRVRFARVGHVWHPAAWLAIGLTSLRDRGDNIPLHVAIDGFCVS
jgi:hypothetical protein